MIDTWLLPLLIGMMLNALLFTFAVVVWPKLFHVGPYVDNLRAEAYDEGWDVRAELGTKSACPDDYNPYRSSKNG